MKNRESVCSYIGVTQREMAQLLGVKLSVWSMFEISRRDLPPKAKLLLAHYLQNVKTSESASKKMRIDAEQCDLKPKYKWLLADTERKLEIVRRRFEDEYEKQKIADRRRALSQCLCGTEGLSKIALDKEKARKTPLTYSEKMLGKMLALEVQQLQLEAVKNFAESKLSELNSNNADQQL